MTVGLEQLAQLKIERNYLNIKNFCVVRFGLRFVVTFRSTYADVSWKEGINVYHNVHQIFSYIVTNRLPGKESPDSYNKLTCNTPGHE